MTVENDTCTSSSSSASGDVTPAVKAKTSLVASYFLRSAMDWRSSKADTPIITTDHPIETNDQEQTKKEEVAVEVEAEPDAATIEERTQFEVTYQCLPSVEDVNEEEDAELTSRQMQYLDVLLQTDEHGIGLNIGLQRGGNGGQVLVVQSFRRRHGDDFGPAEVCGKIRVGDILHAVDGEQVPSLQQLHAKLVGRLGKRRKFVLLRFLRPLALHDAVFDSSRQEVDANETNWSDIDAIFHGNSQVATFVRQLAMRNQLLQEQLITSRLKQEEQSIQLDQLHALYAKTQAEGLPLFSLSKSIRPFSRKTNSALVGDGLEKPIPTKIQTEVIEAVNAEYSRLRQEFQLQYLLDKRELEQKYLEKAQKLEEATAKKVEMLEAGFRLALQHYVNDHHCSYNCQTATTDTMDATGAGLLQEFEFRGSDIKLIESMDNSIRGQNLQQILDLLAKYEVIKHARDAKLQNLSSISVDAPLPE